MSEKNAALQALVGDLKLWACSPRVPLKAQLVMLEAIGRLASPPEVGATVAVPREDLAAACCAVNRDRWACSREGDADGESAMAALHDRLSLLYVATRSPRGTQDRRTIMCPVDGACDSDECRRTQKCSKRAAAQPIEWPFRREPMP